MNARDRFTVLLDIQRQAQATSNPFDQARFAKLAVAELVPLLADLIERAERLERLFEEKSWGSK